MIESQSNEIVLIYHSDKEEDQKMKACVEGIEVFGVKSFDLKTERLSEQELEDIAEKLDMNVTDLFDAGRSSPPKDLSKEEALKLLTRDPMLISTPIIIIGEHAYQFESSAEFIRESATISTIRHNPID